MREQNKNLSNLRTGTYVWVEFYHVKRTEIYHIIIFNAL